MLLVLLKATLINCPMYGTLAKSSPIMAVVPSILEWCTDPNVDLK